MKMKRVVTRFWAADRDAIDELRERYCRETDRRLSRGTVVRALVSMGLQGAAGRSAAEVLPSTIVEASAVRACPPPSRRAREEEPT